MLLKGLVSAVRRISTMATKATKSLNAQSMCMESDVFPKLEEFVVVLNSIPILSSCADVPDDVKKIGTHSGTFHCDEALGCALLQMHPKWKGSAVVRTRNPDELAKCDIVIDVGAEYDHDARRYDHHQRSFSDVLGDGYDTKLSACGLVYKHYGKEVVAALCPDIAAHHERFYKKLYSGFIEHIDAIDNGIEVADGPLRYAVTTNLSARVGALNPPWNKKSSREDVNARFKLAMLVTGREFLSRLEGLASSWWPARAIVEKAVADRLNVHPSGQVIQLPQYCPWQGHIYETEEDAGVAGTILYVLYQDTAGNFRIQAVPEEAGSFASRKKLPAPWRGIRDDALSELTGVDGCIFIHSAGFIGGAKSQEAVLKLANLAVEWTDEDSSAAQ